MNGAAVEELKIKSVFYKAIASNKLLFLLVDEKHEYELYDIIQLLEIDDAGEETGRYCYVRILFMIADPALGLREGYTALSIKLEVQSSRFKLGSPTPKTE